jgi:CubicO group peptidase (beta-lactamase class C family)
VLSPRGLMVFLIGIAWLFGTRPALAQPDIPTERLNLPPVAAPTSKIDVNSIPVVRSESQGVRDFATGLIVGLMRAYHLKELAIVAVEHDHVMFAEGFGASTPDSEFALGRVADVFTAVAAMQQVQKGKIRLDEDVSKVLGEQRQRKFTPGELLSGAVRDTALLRELVAKATGMDFRASVKAAILKPLGMTATGYDAAGLNATPNDMAHLMIALVDGGNYAGNVILQPQTVALMERTQRAPIPGLPGWTYGFSEMRRNGRNALQHDGATRGSNGAETRLVILPQAGLGYFVAITGRAPAAFWRTLDDTLFDKIAPPRPVNAGGSGASAPSATDARQVAGVYVPVGTGAARMAGLKLGSDRIRLTARGDAALALSGALTGVLMPQPGGRWSAENESLVVAIAKGRLVFGHDDYRPLAVWKMPVLYAWLALLAALTTVGASYYERRAGPAGAYPGYLMLSAGGASLTFLLVSVLVYLLAPLGA